VVLVPGGLGMAVAMTGAALAGANDYVFEPVKAEVKKGDDVIVSVRLKHKVTGKSVSDAVIVQTRIDMSPDAMGEMASPLTPVASNEPGVYSFKTDLSMQGRWLLSIAAKVQGEPETLYAPSDLYNPTAEAAEDAKAIPGARYVVIPSLQGHFAASPAKAADVEFMNRTITEFLENITEGGSKLK
jgi:hypothetical protein